MIPFFDCSQQTERLMDELRPAMERVVRSQRFILGEEVAGFEREIGSYLDVAHAIGVSSGTDALTIALSALGVGPGDEVITTPFTFFATTGAILRVGARPVFADIEAHGFNLDPERVARVITPRTKAILPVHLFGQAADLDALSSFGVPVIEDAAQALGATYQGRRVGGIGTLGCVSFFPTKNLGAFGDGGLVVTNDDELAALARSLRGHGFGKTKHHSERLGGNYRLDALQAAVLRVKLPHLERFNALRRSHAEHYRSALGGSTRYALPSELPGRTHVYNQFVIRAPDRERVVAHLLERGVRTEHYYPYPIHLQRACAERGHGPGDFPEAEAAAREAIALPIFPELEDWMLNAVCEALLEP